MVQLVAEIPIALVVFLLWLTVVSVLVRPFGIQLPLTPFRWAKHRAAFQALPFSQYLIVGGVLYFGCGMLIMSSMSRYLDWKYWHSSPFTSETLVREICSSIMAGVFFGLISWSSLGGNARK